MLFKRQYQHSSVHQGPTTTFQSNIETQPGLAMSVIEILARSQMGLIVPQSYNTPPNLEGLVDVNYLNSDGVERLNYSEALNGLISESEVTPDTAEPTKTNDTPENNG